MSWLGRPAARRTRNEYVSGLAPRAGRPAAQDFSEPRAGGAASAELASCSLRSARPAPHAAGSPSVGRLARPSAVPSPVGHVDPHLGLLVHLEPGAGRDQVAEDHVLLQARPGSPPCRPGPPRSAPWSSPGTTRPDEAVRLHGRLGDAQEHAPSHVAGSGVSQRRLLLALGLEPGPLLLERLAADDLARPRTTSRPAPRPSRTRSISRSLTSRNANLSITEPGQQAGVARRPRPSPCGASGRR